MTKKPKISIVVLTFCRKNELVRNVSELLSIDYDPIEIIVVDNASDYDVSSCLSADPRLKIILLEKNVGVAGRNVGINASSGDFIVTLDDDVFGLKVEHILSFVDIFSSSDKIGAINFKVIDDLTEQQVNWIHHKKIEDYCDKTFSTYEISEGAVVFRNKALKRTNLYPEYFFISHEGPDLALQIIKNSQSIIYFPEIVVRHSHAVNGRPSWRRYYFDTRNQIWLAIRHYPLKMALRKLFFGLGSMFVYSIRDGYLVYFMRGAYDATKDFNKAFSERVVLSGEPYRIYAEIEKYNPSFYYMLKKRLFNNKVRL